MYTVEKVYFESLPGLLVTGNLYRPRGGKDPYPGILCPHGHWAKGRLENSQNVSVPGRCINLALQGYVVFSYDMIGFGDSQQLPPHYGSYLISEAEHLWGISLTGLQLANSIRSIDFLCLLPEVDCNRIGCTGASGGGTQTYLLTAVDERIKVAAPVNMISAHFQGGCACENGPSLRLDTFNVEIAALAAPRPLLMVSATRDWTKNNPFVEYPAIRAIYSLFDEEEKVACIQVDAKHNYNRTSREAVYSWFARWLKEEKKTKILEKEFQVDPQEKLKVFAHCKFPHVPRGEELINSIIDQVRSQLDTLYPKGRKELHDFKKIMRPAWQHIFSVKVPKSSELVVEEVGSAEMSEFKEKALLLGRKGVGDKIPTLLYTPADKSEYSKEENLPAILVVHGKGKRELVNIKRAKPSSFLSSLLRKGYQVLAIDPFLTGEFHSFGAKSGRRQTIKFFTTYNVTDTALRVQDILTAYSYLKGYRVAASIDIIGLGQGGLWCLLARPLIPNVKSTVIDANKIQVDRDEDFLQDIYVPGLRRIGDIRAALTLIAPHRLLIHNLGSGFPVQQIQALYREMKAEEALYMQENKLRTQEIVDGLKKI